MRVTGRILPLDSLHCGDHPEQLNDPCQKDSYFEVSANGPTAVAALPSYVDATGTWDFELWLPLEGTYKIEARLLFLNFKDMLTNYASQQAAVKYTRAPPPGVVVPRLSMKPVIGGERNFTIKLPLGVDASRGPLCSLQDFEGLLPGYHDKPSGGWQPYTCSLRRLNETAFSRKWIRLVGDSSSRSVYHQLCFAAKGKTERTDRSRVMACIGKDFVISAEYYYPESCNLTELLSRPLSEVVAHAKRTLPPHFNFTEPTVVFISLGSHTFQQTRPGPAPKVLAQIQLAIPKLLMERRVVILLTSANSAKKFLPKFSHYSPFQNNPRAAVMNEVTLETFAGKVPILDFFSTTLAFALVLRSSDALHFKFPLYDQHARLVAHLTNLISDSSSNKQ